MRKSEAEKIQRLQRLVENLEPGRVLTDQYVILEKAGAGAEGVVYIVRDLFTRTERAIKFYLDPDSIRHLTKVAHKMTHLHHENIVRHYGVGRVRLWGENVLFLIMEAYHGIVLFEYQREFRGRRLGVFEAMKYFADVIRGLSYAHSLGFVHGDIHRENVVLHEVRGRSDREYIAKLNDFFPAGKTRSVARRQVDIKEAGFLLYEMLTGKIEYRAEALSKVPPECAQLIRTCIHRDRRRRFTDTRKILQALRNLQWL